MQTDLPLLIMADIPQSFCLTDLILLDQAMETIDLRPSQYENQLDVMIGGMTFALIHYSPEDIDQSLATADFDHIFCDPTEQKLSGIGIALGEHIKSAKHSETVNRALLQLGRYVGQSIKATAVIWRPAQLQIGFAYFIGATDHYIEGGPFPVLAQIAISKAADGSFLTSGLSYFSGQEVTINTPAGYAPNEVVKRLVRIAHDIATNGKVDKSIETEGFVSGEILSLVPREDGQVVEITIVPKEPRQLH